MNQRNPIVLSLMIAVLTAAPLAAQPAPAPRNGPTASLSDDQIRDIIIQRSITAYSGRCPCPENRMSNGARCGHRSAYERPNGEAPKCYRRDVSDEEVARFRAASEH
ncbi:hypothetical protein [uncultured Maricaulis sp.]|uniref:hypothetical protein n=1 Tax=uncultured Maricaulis sp. TaxID=174710 RepID=UPI0030DCBE1A